MSEKRWEAEYRLELPPNKLEYENTFKFEKSIQEHHSWRYRLGYNNFEPIVLLVNDEICGHAGLIPANIKIDNKITNDNLITIIENHKKVDEEIFYLKNK